MKHIIILVLILASASALPGREIRAGNLVVPEGLPEGRISHGKVATQAQFPFQVLLYVIDNKNHGEMSPCGGSLLNHEWVLTAAHCTITAEKVKVLLGATTRTSANVVHTVAKKNIINHSGYKDLDTGLLNDISLIKIPFTKYSANIKPVKLPAKSNHYSNYADEKVLASGWGNTEKSEGASKLLWAPLTVMPNEECDKEYDIFPTNLCTATTNGVNICDGDSGGPLVLESTKTQIGIISYGDENCTEAIPAVYVRVTSYLDWIKEHTKISF